MSNIKNNHKQLSLGNLQNQFMISQQKIIKQMHKQVQNKEFELQELNRQFNDFKTKTKAMKEENGKLKTEIIKLNKKLEILQETLQEQMQKYNNFKIKENTQQQEIAIKLKNYEVEISKISEYKFSIEEMTAEIKEIMTQNKILKQINEKLQNELQRLHLQLREYCETQQILTQQSNMLQRLKQENNHNFNNLRHKYIRLKDRLKVCEEQLSKFQIQNRNLLLISKQNNQRLEKEFVSLNRNLKALELKNKQYQFTLKESIIENEKLRKLIQNYRQKHKYQQINEFKIIDLQKKRYFPNDSSLDEDSLQL